MLQPWTCHCGQANAGPAPCSACLNAAPPEVAGATARAGVGRYGPRRTVLVALAVATAVLLVGGIAGAATVGTADGRHDGHGDGPAGATTARTVEVRPDSTPAPGASELEQALPGLMRFTQQARGLPFTRPVKVTLLPDQAFRARLAAQEDDDAEEAEAELRTTQRVLQGLGLLDRDVDLAEAVDSLYGDAVAGFYDTEQDDLVVRGEALTVSVRTTLVHELTHALQDQHFDIDREDLDDRDDEASTGLTGLVEGDAVRVERLYLDSLSAKERKRGEAEELAAGAGIDADIPRVLLQLVAFPYVYGPEFATAVVQGGGQARLDAAFADPPTTSEQLLHPAAFLRGDPVRTPATPKPEGEEIDQGVLGELGLLLVLGGGGPAAQRAAAGWGGDRYVAWRDGDDTCVRVHLEMDTPQDDAEVRRALDALADGRDGLTVTGRGPFVVTSCG